VLTTSQKIEIAQVITGRARRDRASDRVNDRHCVGLRELLRGAIAVERSRKVEDDSRGSAVAIDAIGASEQGANAEISGTQREAYSELAAPAIFAIAVVVVGRWRGLGALVGLAITWLVMVRFVLPAILEGGDPVAVSVVGAAIVVLVVLYVAHGVTARTTTAVLGTLASLSLLQL